jgi:hypothetical protein
MSAATPDAGLGRAGGAAQGYLLVAGSFLIMGLIGALVDWATAPESGLLVIDRKSVG